MRKEMSDSNGEKGSARDKGMYLVLEFESIRSHWTFIANQAASTNASLSNLINFAYSNNTAQCLCLCLWM